jgi:uncharacterized protein
MTEQKIVWVKTEAQKKRLEEHKSSVSQSEDGSLQFHSNNIITPKGLEKVNKLISVVPKPTEEVISFNNAKFLFQDLKQMNLILTNACNLSCSYCYEQHKKDFGRFTDESLLTAYRFLREANQRQRKVFQFFGGEPLIHEPLILQFLKNNAAELEQYSVGENNTVVSMVTNGLLLSKELIDEYFSYSFTWMLISLDTDRSEVDHREIGQDKINTVMDYISMMPEDVKSAKRVTIRCTLARENAPYFKEFVEHLYSRGIRRMVVHPLVLDSARGFIKWSDDEWNGLHDDILEVLDYYDDLNIHFSEGVGQKGEENCMIGADMIAIDGSGDYSGCYFFTNQKAGPTGETILGNLWQDKIYIDRYRNFQLEYAKMFEEEEQCKTCDYKNACYQCPAGNLDTGSKQMFRPDDMCQKIVKLFVDLQEDVAKKQFKKKYESIASAVEVMGEHPAFVKGISYLLFYYFYNFHPNTNKVHDGIEDITDYRQLLSLWKKIINLDVSLVLGPDRFVEEITSLVDDSVVEISDLYYYILQKGNLVPNAKKIDSEDITLFQRTFFLSLLHIIILQSEAKALAETFNHKLVKNVKDKSSKSKTAI